MILALSFSVQAGQGLRPFSTDGCTLSPDGTPARPSLWRACCVAHDLRLWGGGTREQRDSADLKLRSCVRERAGATVADIIYGGVRAGTYSPIRIPSKVWGNAWYERAGYRVLAPHEVQLLIDQLPELPIPDSLRETYRAELEARLGQ